MPADPTPVPPASGPVPPGRLERVEYAEALLRQREMVRRRASGELSDCVWYLEHPPVITWGSKGGLDHLRVPPGEIIAWGAALQETDRGGDVTYHGPGQLVGYPIIDLGSDRDLHRYLRALEEALIGAIGVFGLAGARVTGRTGVWVGGSKIVAIGVRVSRWITSHGFALNVDCDLSGFNLIIPCGIADAGVTSMALQLELTGGRPCPGVSEMARAVHPFLERALGRKLGTVPYFGSRQSTVDS